MRIVKGLWRSLRMREIREDDTDARLGWLLVAGTIPVGIIGLLLAGPAAQTVRLAAVGGGVPDRQRHRAAAVRAAAPAPAARRATIAGDVDGRLAKLSWRQAIAVGTSQAAR